MADTIVLFNHETNAYESVPADQAQAAVASGKYADPGNQTFEGAGGSTVRPVSEANAAATQGEAPAIAEPARRAAEQRSQQRAESLSDPVLTFAEAVVDTLTLGLVHEPGEKGDIRRGEDKNSHLLGTLVGLGAGLSMPGAVKGVAKGGQAAGKALAEALMGEAKAGSKLGKVITRAAEEAGTNAALMGATAFGHQLTDTIIEDKPFAGEVVLSDVGLGAMLGAGAGLLSGGFSAARATRAGIRGQGGLVAPESATVLERVGSVRSAWDQAVETHAQRVGVLDVLAKEGAWSGDALAERQAALSRAQKAGKVLSGLDSKAALDGSTKEYAKWRRAVEDYQQAVSDLDDVMRPGIDEVNEKLARDYVQPSPGPEFGKPNSFQEGVDPALFRLSEKMGPEQRAAYERIYGEPFKDAESVLDDIVGPGEKGVVTPTSEAGTMAGKRAAGKVGTQVGSAAAPLSEGAGKAVASEADFATPFTRQGSPAGQAPYEAPAMPGAKFGPGDLEGHVGVDRPLRQRVGEFPDLLGHDAHPWDQVLMQDGRIVAAKPIQENAADFMRFREKVLGDTMAREAAESSVRMSTVEGAEHAAPVDLDRTAPGKRAPELVAEAARAAKLPTGETGPFQSSGPAKSGPNVKQYIDEWFQASKRGPARVSPGDEAAAKLQEAMDQLREASGGRLDSAASLELGEHLGLPPARSALGEKLDQLWAVKQAAKLAADGSRGVGTALDKSSRSYVRNWLLRRVGGKIGAAVAGGLVGKEFGGEYGFIAGAALAAQYSSFGARAASAAGRMYERTLAVGDALLRGPRATLAARAVAGNRPYAYSDSGPINDPVQRIIELQTVARNPERLRAVARKQMGDVSAMSPELAQHIEDNTVRQVQALALKAPAIYFNPLGQAIAPSAGKLRQFFEAENATHDLPGLLNAVASGSATDVQLDMLRLQFPMVHSKIAQRVLQYPEQLKKLPAQALKGVERVLGYPLTTSGRDPDYVNRMQQSWQMQSQPQGGQASPGKPQAFKITAPKPTPVQAASTGRAPGNEEP